MDGEWCPCQLPGPWRGPDGALCCPPLPPHGLCCSTERQDYGHCFRALLTAPGELTEVHLRDTMPYRTAGGRCHLQAVLYPAWQPTRMPSPHMELHESPR